MTPEQQRIAIAEACGHKNIARHLRCEGTGMDFREWYAGIPDRGGYAIPYYLNDLNAMNEAEKMLTEKQRDGSDGYMEWLDWVVVRDGVNGRSWDTAHATAAHRAEAFLRTIGKWEASK